MKGEQEILFALRAGYSFFYVRSLEMERTVETIVETISEYKNGEGTQVYNPVVWDFEKNPDPEACLFESLDKSEPGTVVVAKNFHWFFSDDYNQANKQFCSFLQNRFELYTTTEFRKAFIVVGDVAIEDAVPLSIAKEFLPVEMGLPTEEELKEVYSYIIESVKDTPGFTVPDDDQGRMLVDASKGMTLRGAKNAFAYALVKGKGTMSPKTISLMKATDVEKTAGLHLVDVPWTFDDLRGYENVKEFTLKTHKSPLARGILLLGPPGTGKTRFAYCFGNETGLPVFEMEVAELFGGLVGDTETLWRNCLDVVAANTPCVLIADK